MYITIYPYNIYCAYIVVTGADLLHLEMRLLSTKHISSIKITGIQVLSMLPQSQYHFSGVLLVGQHSNKVQDTQPTPPYN